MDAPRDQSAAPPGYEQIDCPACGGSGGQVVLRGRDRILDPSLELTIVRCGQCRLCYLNPRPLIQRLGVYYPQHYHAYRRQKGDVIGNAASVRLRRLVLRQMFGRAADRPRGGAGLLAKTLLALRGREAFADGLPVRGEGRLLDFGCGAGKLLRQMQVAGWQVVGLDFSGQAVAAAREAGLEAHQGTLPHPDIPPASFDGVIMQHALEHVPDPLPVLGATMQVLRPGGTLLVQVPNFASWEVQHLGEAAVQVDVPRHLLHFEPDTLASLLQQAGFADVQVQARPRRGFIRQSIDRARQQGQDVPKWMTLKLVHRLLIRRLRGTVQGSELVATASRAG